jgi:predicted transcriptional regulator
MEQRVITAHIPMPLAKQIDAIADRLDRSRGWILKQALFDWVALEEERRRMTLDALSEVDREEVVGEAEVQAWAESLGSPESLPPPC